MCRRILCMSFIIGIVSGSGVELTMEGLDKDSCQPTDPLRIFQICNYNFTDDALGTTLPLTCVLSGTNESSRTATYIMKFENKNKTVEFKPHVASSATLPFNVKLDSANKNVTCTATKGNKWSILVNINYIPRPTSPTTTEPLSNEDTSKAWLQWVLAGGALLLTICIVGGFIVKYRQKKPQSAESTYANMGKDQNTYQTMPVPAPRTQRPKVTPETNAACKPTVALENNYSEPKDSQDMSEALYADPKRFNAESDTYAEPYVKSKCPKSDTYAEPYKSNYAEPYASNSEGNYAELSQPDSSDRELYSRPIPKAQRKPKVKDDSNYSNVFGDEYANTKK